MAEPEASIEPTTAEQTTPPAQRAGRGRAVPIMLAVNTLAVLAMVSLQVVQLVRPFPARAATRADEHGAAAAAHERTDRGGTASRNDGQPGPTLRLADFVVHLRDPETDRYARMSFEIELPDEKSKESVNVRMPQIRDAFLAFLSDRTAEELRGSEAIARIKGALAQKLSELAPGAGVRGLYLTELVVQ